MYEKLCLMIQIFNLYIYECRVLFTLTFVDKYVYVCVCVFYISNPTSSIHIVPFFFVTKCKSIANILVKLPYVNNEI